MTDDAGPTPAEEQEVARMLAEAGGPISTPPRVVERLDHVLSELMAAGSPPEAEGVTDVPEEGGHDLPELRARRRRWPQVLMAASAAVIAGYGATAVLGQGSLSGADDAGGGSSMPATDDEGRSGPESSSARSGGDAGSGYLQEDRLAGKRLVAPNDASVLRLRADRLESGVRRVLRTTTTAADTLSPREERAARQSGCVPPAVGRGDVWYAVRLDGRRTSLVTEPEQAGLVQATVYSCSGEVLAEAAVDAP